MTETIGNLSVQYNRQERVWEVAGGAEPQRFHAGGIGKQAAIRHAIGAAYPEVAAAVASLIAKNEQASGRAWAAARLLVGGHVREPGAVAEQGYLACVRSPQNGGPPHHYYIGSASGQPACTCPDFAAGGVVVDDRSLCKHLLAFLLGRHLAWLLQPAPETEPPEALWLKRQAAGRWRGRQAIRVNGTATTPEGSPEAAPAAVLPAGIPAYANGEPVSFAQQAAYASFVATTGRPPYNQEKLLSWYYGR